ncbi:unnamed protein product [Prorocentrum cordatum]|uniref:Uncharacterized protein n=1 Tax=Prorocentrum cordatum TaxID=2364126 RepID=A0ABN9WEA6_9DINO|nr:unnamed protein product [Polarella glacialis]
MDSTDDQLVPLPARARPHREPGPVGGQAGRHAEKGPPGGAHGASSPPQRGGVGAAGGHGAASLAAGPALERGVGKQTSRHAEKGPLGGAHGASTSPPQRGSVGAPGRHDAASPAAGPVLERGVGTVRFGGVEPVREISPSSGASAQDSPRPPQSPPSPGGHVDSSSPFFGGCLRAALAGDGSGLAHQGCAASPRG